MEPSERQGTSGVASRSRAPSSELHRDDAAPSSSRAGTAAPIFRARGLSLKVRLLLLVIASIVAPIAFLTVLYITRTSSVLERELLSRGELVAKTLDDWLARHERWESPELAAEVERLIAAGNGVRRITVFLRSAEGSLEAAAVGGRLGPVHVGEIEVRNEEMEAVRLDREVVQEVYRPEGGGLERFEDIAAPLHGTLPAGGRGVVGAVDIEVSLAELDRLVAQLRNTVIAIALPFLVLTSGFLLLYLSRAIGRPTNALVAAMDRARRGDLAVEATVEHLDEFGWLTENFNRLLRRVREVDELLKAKVEAATAELARKNVELVRANERLFETERSVARLERLSSLGQLASTIAHEVGTPLNAIYGHIQIMRQDPPLLERHGERLKVIESQIERLTTIIQGVLTDLRAPDARPEPVDLNGLLRELATFTGAAIAGRSVTLELALGADVPAVLADRAQLSQVFVNLLTNALDAMPAGGRLTIETRRAALPGDRAEPAVAVEFADTGVGISPEGLKRVFEPFYSTKALGQGTGLGLSIVQQVVKRHGGTVTVASEAGKGSRFVVVLPRAPVGVAA